MVLPDSIAHNGDEPRTPQLVFFFCEGSAQS